MATTIRHQNDYLAKPQQTVYSYDQLNRIYEMYVQNSINGNTWANSYSSDIYNESYFYDANGNITNLSRKDKDGNYLDNMTYNYQAGTNKLNYIADPYHPTSVDIEGQSANNYAYDAIGNLTQDVKGGLSSIAWNPYGKITQISKGTNGNLYYDYDAMGNRIKKNFTQSNDNADNTWYVRDASGNIMAIYSRKNYGTNQQVLLENYELYGSSRLGSLNLGMAVEGDYNLTPTTNYTRSLGLKQYELSNHLGNVLTTFSDQRVFAPAGMSSTNSNALIAKLISAQDYYPFGMLMDGRSWNEDKIKFGFNGQEMDNEIDGEGDYLNFKYRIYDSRIGKFLSVDPLFKAYPWNSTYAFAENRVIDGIDLEGLEYVTRRHIVDKNMNVISTTDILYYQMDNQHLRLIGGTPRDFDNAAGYGPEGRGVKHEYYFQNGKPARNVIWEQRQILLKDQLGKHGLYSGPGSITKTGLNPIDYDFSFKPIDAADEIAKVHDMQYFTLAPPRDYQGFIEDTRTLYTDKQMVKSVKAFLSANIRNLIKPTANIYSNETVRAALSQLLFIGALATYKEWKVARMREFGLDINNIDHMQDPRVTLEAYKPSLYEQIFSPSSRKQYLNYLLLKSAK